LSNDIEKPASREKLTGTKVSQKVFSEFIVEHNEDEVRHGRKPVSETNRSSSDLVNAGSIGNEQTQESFEKES
jgi:hypothetical protein